MVDSTLKELGSHAALMRFEAARALTSYLITDRPPKQYDQTREFVSLLQTTNGKKVMLTHGLMVYVYAKFAGDVDRRPTQSARRYYLPKGTELAREYINGRLSTAARTLSGARLVMSLPKGGMVKLYTAIGFAEPTGRSAGARGGRRGSPAMDKSSNT